MYVILARDLNFEPGIKFPRIFYPTRDKISRIIYFIQTRDKIS